VKGAGLLLALLASGCGTSGGLWVRVEAPLRVPDQCDQLDVYVWRGLAQGPPMFHGSYPLAGSQQFPMTLALTTSDGANYGADGLTASATATLQTATVATGSSQATLVKGQLTELDLALRAGP
jgi:hypothetical protein